MKKLRSTLKLVRPVIGDEAYQRENGRFRDAGPRALRRPRRPGPRRDRRGAGRALRRRRPAGRLVDGARRSARRRTARADGELGVAARPDGRRDRDGRRARSTTGRSASSGFDLLRPGPQAGLRARRASAIAEAREDPTDENLHEFRKRSKDLWYQLRLVRRGWPEVIETTADEAHELSDLLGDDHDLVVLGADLERGFEPLTDDQREHLRELIARAARELQEQAFALAERIFAEKPKRFVEADRGLLGGARGSSR